LPEAKKDLVLNAQTLGSRAQLCLGGAVSALSAWLWAAAEDLSWAPFSRVRYPAPKRYWFL